MNGAIRQRIRSELALAGIACAAALAMFPGAAVAAGPIHSTFTLSGETPLCGLTVTQSGGGLDNFSPVFDSAGNLIAFTDRYLYQFSFSYSSKSIDLMAAGTVQAMAVNNPDGSRTVTFTYIGLPEKWSSPGGSTITRDAGIITLVASFSADGTEVDTIPRVAGPHPEADSGFALQCQVVLAVLT